MNNCKPVHGYYGKYEVDLHGNVWSLRKGRKKLSPQFDGKYFRVSFSVNGVASTYSVHRVVLEAFVGLRPDGMVACHNNGDSKDNRIDNLRWDTASANTADKRRHGTIARGEKIGCAKLTNQDVLEIRRLLKYKWATGKELAERYGVGAGRIADINTGKKWGWLHEC